jgi:hypothetical protein
MTDDEKILLTVDGAGRDAKREALARYVTPAKTLMRWVRGELPNPAIARDAMHEIEKWEEA